MPELWYDGPAILASKKSKSIVHPFVVRNHRGLTINPYQGCQHRCAYCYATYEWSPEFYNKIYAKSNAAEVLESQLAKWRQETVEPVMISSATDCYQPAELRFSLTRKCVEVLQKHNVPYYVFTKSALIERDLELHSRYKHSCFIVWSITSCNESVRRVVEPGTPPADRIFATIKKFAEAGVRCGVNIDPIMPLISDSEEDLDLLVKNSVDAGVGNAFGAIMRLRKDIWERMKIVLGLLRIQDGAERYLKIYNFEEAPSQSYLAASGKYSRMILRLLETKVRSSGMICGFPGHLVPRKIEKSRPGQQSLAQYLYSQH